MDLLFQSLIGVVGFLALCFFVGSAIAYWIARGEPDVNGDPERDAGGGGSAVQRFSGSTVKPTSSRVDCGWCGALLKHGSEPVSHGICATCFDRMARTIENHQPSTINHQPSHDTYAKSN